MNDLVYIYEALILFVSGEKSFYFILNQGVDI